MLSGAQLATAISAVLVTAVVLGWILHWIWVRLSNAATSDKDRLADMSNRLHDANRAREEAEEARELAENLLASREAETEQQLAEMQARMDGAVEGREAELIAELREARTDSETSMAGLRAARTRIMELEAEIEQLRTDG